MAVEVVNLCPEKINLVDDVKITSKSLKTMLEGAGIPFNVGANYVLVPQLNHAQQIGDFPASKRFVLVEVENGSVKAIRTISINALTQRVLGIVEQGKDAPVIKAKLDNGVHRPDGYKGYVPTVNSPLPLSITSDSRAFVANPVTIKAVGRKDCYVPEFEEKNGAYDMKAKNGAIVPTVSRYNFFEVVPTSKADVEAAIAAIKNSKFSEFLK